MNPLTIAGVLFIITAILHVATLVLYGNTAATRPVAGFGIVYLFLGILLLATTFGWVPIVALVLTTIGGIGAVTQLKANPDMRNMNLLLIAIDVVIIILLLLALIG
jgi:hypothetical protein